MRHLKSGKRLGLTTSHRKALMRNLVTALLEHRQIKTTVTKAKEMRKYFDKMITLGKQGTLHARRQALSFVKSKKAVNYLFNEYASYYKDRNGGYTRIFRLDHRLGDNAQMALIQMVGYQDLQNGENSSSDQKNNDNTLKEVQNELKNTDTEENTVIVNQEDQNNNS